MPIWLNFINSPNLTAVQLYCALSDIYVGKVDKKYFTTNKEKNLDYLYKIWSNKLKDKEQF